MTARDFLIFNLSGLMMAYGEIAVGERRSLWDAPSKSGVLGFLAACLGIQRGEEEKLAQLDNALGFAVRVDGAGTPLRDYHTTQSPKEVSLKQRRKFAAINTRKDELACDDLGTILSQRFYRVEAKATIALWLKGEPLYTLSDLAKSLKEPCYTPYLGRKSCPLGVPPQPKTINANGLLDAFQQYDGLAEAHIWFEYGAGLDKEDAAARQIRSRRDALRSRKHWHFFERREGQLKPDPEVTP